MIGTGRVPSLRRLNRAQRHHDIQNWDAKHHGNPNSTNQPLNPSDFNISGIIKSRYHHVSHKNLPEMIECECPADPSHQHFCSPASAPSWTSTWIPPRRKHFIPHPGDLKFKPQTCPKQNELAKLKHLGICLVVLTTASLESLLQNKTPISIFYTNKWIPSTGVLACSRCLLLSKGHLILKGLL